MPAENPGAAFVDLLVLATVFWGVWSLRFLGVSNIGLWTMLSGVSAGAVLLTLRRGNWRDLGLRAGGGLGWTLGRAAEFGLLVLLAGGLVIGVATALGFPPKQSVVLAEQPTERVPFFLDILVGVWIGSAIGEEIFFRGFLLSKVRALFGGGRTALALAIFAQAVWFGAGHASQGVSGMIATGVIGLALGVFFITRARGALIPLIIGHGMVNTVTQTLNFIANANPG